MKNFINIKTAITAEYNKRKEDFASEIQPLNVEDLKNWRYKDLLTPATKNKNWPSLQDLKNYMVSRYNKNQDKQLQKKLDQISVIESAPDLVDIKISIEWKKNRTWGANPTGEANFSFITSDGYKQFNTVYSGSIGGCGYDKLSTAVAECLNQINPLTRRLYEVRENNLQDNLNTVFGYGSGYGLLPRFEGGVGVSCYPDIFKKIGFDFNSIASGSTFNVYQVTSIYKEVKF